MKAIDEGLGSGSVESAFAACSEDVRVRARNFWYGLRLLPPERFRALCAIYAWMRRADDLADEDAPGMSIQARRDALDRFRNCTHRVFSGRSPEAHPAEEGHIWLAMGHVVMGHELDLVDFDLMIDGQLADLEPRVITDVDELLQYCDQVASTVGRTCVRIWGASSPEALRMSSERGVAFQLTNILRDVREDHGRGRVYLPADLLARHELDVEGLLAWRDDARCRRVVGEIASMAREGYRRSAALDDLIEPDCRPTSWAMTTIYRSLLEKIAHRPRLLAGTGRVRLSSLRKAAIALRARRFAWYRTGERGVTVE